MARTAKQIAAQLAAAKASAAKRRRKAASLAATRQTKYGTEHTARKGNAVRAINNQLTYKPKKIVGGATYNYGGGTISRSRPGRNVGHQKAWVSRTPKQQDAVKKQLRTWQDKEAAARKRKKAK